MHTSEFCKGVCTCHHDNWPLWTDELVVCRGRPTKPSDTAASLVNPVSTNGISRDRRDAFCNENPGNKSYYSSTFHLRWRSNTLRVTAWAHSHLLDWKNWTQLKLSRHFYYIFHASKGVMWNWQLKTPCDLLTVQRRHLVAASHQFRAIFFWGMRNESLTTCTVQEERAA